MRQKLIKSFLIVATAVIFLLITRSYNPLKESNPNRVLKTYLLNKSILNPNRIDKDYQYTVLASMYLSLFKFERQVLTSELCDAYYWEGNTLYCELKNDITTQSGYRITSKDVLASLARSSFLNASTHFSLRSLLIEDMSATIYKHDAIEAISSRKIAIHFKKKTSQVFEILSSADFIIIPEPAFSINRESIESFKETSGYYYLSFEDEYSRVFRLNNRFKDLNISNEVIIRYDFMTDELITDKTGIKFKEKFDEGGYNYIAFVANSTESQRNIIINNGDFESIETKPFSSLDGRWTKNADDIDSKQKKILGSKLKELFEKAPLGSKTRFTSQFFIENSFGSIKEVPDWKALSKLSLDLPRKIRIGAPAYSWLTKVFSDLNSIIEIVPASSYQDNNIDLYIVNVDQTYRPSKTAISSYYSFGAFLGANLSKEQFYNELSLIDSEAEFSNFAKNIHNLSLNKNGTLIPFCKFPYQGVHSSKLKVSFDPYSALVPFQNIEWK